jgi:hypothetical protein
VEQTGSSSLTAACGEPDAVKVARPVREGGPGKRVSSNADTAPGADPHWADGGETSLENSALLCERHHTKIHSGFRIERDTGGHWHTYRPDDTEILLGAALLS